MLTSMLVRNKASARLYACQKRLKGKLQTHHHVDVSVESGAASSKGILGGGERSAKSHHGQLETPSTTTTGRLLSEAERAVRQWHKGYDRSEGAKVASDILKVSRTPAKSRGSRLAELLQMRVALSASEAEGVMALCAYDVAMRQCIYLPEARKDIHAFSSLWPDKWPKGVLGMGAVAI